MNNAATVTVHGVLAAAYPGKSKAKLDGSLLTHASTDEGETALCGKVKAGHLCDVVEDGEPTCKYCARKLAAAATKAKAQAAANNAAFAELAASAAGLVKRGRGRPRNDASGVAGRVVGVRLTVEAYERLAAQAAAAGTSMSEILRGAWENEPG
jgi:hypothetical protein